MNMPRSRTTGTQSRRTKGTSTSTKSVSASDPRFPEIAINNGILAPMDSTNPSNFDEIFGYLNRPRESASPELDEYKQYLFDTATAENEDSVMQPVIGLLKKYNDGSYRSAYNQQFIEYPDNVGFNNGLSAPKPDLVQGINLQDFKPYPAREKLGGSAVPTPSKYAITLAHMAGEFKKPGGNLIQAQEQAAYDAASLVYGRNRALASMGKADTLATAHVGTFISDGTHIITSAHFATTGASGETVYQQKPTTDTNMNINFESFKTGRQRLRNLQDLTRKNSHLLKKELSDHYKLSQAQSSEQPISGVNGYSEHENGCSSVGGSIEVGSESYVLVNEHTQPQSLHVLEEDAFYIVPQSSAMPKRLPKQRVTRSSARLLKRGLQKDDD